MRLPTRPRSRSAATAAALTLTLGSLSGCGTDSEPGGGPASQSVVVLAASSLTESLTQAARDFETSHSGIDVQLSFASSSTVVTQVNQGAPADLIALAGASALDPLEKSRIAGDGVRTLAGNTLEIATPPSNPGGVNALADLSRRDLKVVLCAPSAPCGKAAAKALTAAGVAARVVSYENNVKATLAKVQLGEADAAIVYHSDVVSAGTRVHGVPIPASVNQRLEYPMARLNDDPTTMAFTTYLLSEQGRKHLRDHGFLMP